MRKLLRKIRELFTLRCPECGGKLHQYLNPGSGPNIYHCEKCGKDWICL